MYTSNASKSMRSYTRVMRKHLHLYEKWLKTLKQRQDNYPKADEDIPQRRVTAYEAGRPVDLPTVLRHELLQVPVLVAGMNDTLSIGNKSVLADKLTKDICKLLDFMTRYFVSSLMDIHWWMLSQSLTKQ